MDHPRQDRAGPIISTSAADAFSDLDASSRPSPPGLCSPRLRRLTCRTNEASRLSTEPTPAEKPCGYGQAKPCGAVKPLPASLSAGVALQRKQQRGISRTCLATGGGQADQLAVGMEFKSGLGVGLAHRANCSGLRRSSGCSTSGLSLRAEAGDAGDMAGNAAQFRPSPVQPFLHPLAHDSTPAYAVAPGLQLLGAKELAAC